MCPPQSPAYAPYVVANCEIHVHPRTYVPYVVAEI